jgi:hypothetical protein
MNEYEEVHKETTLIAKRCLDVIRASARIATMHRDLAAKHYEKHPTIEGYNPDGKAQLVRARPWPSMPTWVIGIRYADHAVRDGSGYAAFNIEEAKEIYDFLRPIFQERGGSVTTPAREALDNSPGHDQTGKAEPGK